MDNKKIEVIMDNEILIAKQILKKLFGEENDYIDLFVEKIMNVVLLQTTLMITEYINKI